MPKEHITKSMGMKYIIQPNIPLKKVGFSAKIWSVDSDRTDHKQYGATVRRNSTRICNTLQFAVFQQLATICNLLPMDTF